MPSMPITIAQLVFMSIAAGTISQPPPPFLLRQLANGPGVKLSPKEK